ncbi:MAG: hypothetical protein A2381_16145 [Bdellovibrionales bacterium RIFOXYB1_FULL_37_110]|nr:MAG: hypothetical protein A2417_07995 [Bdellovibrionales bacterium RIFOXYC1_FULL_37_79]OFZ57144.1 MAG: hypothetical protein A2381_16145 [Bdellovibrionales bacterium RIFOXYB1_FULL_37_110]OFZ65372.1 MAG: hypothetical protein A2577_03725 [Bdellovibrionales bacterium RIFOXYD1_FULL_36_51]OFZ67623.1 MAG: hypothetical protein A2328_08370 [Bdellovibrionales bacterium RIFOXYB2_FULL_36_6]
MFVIKILIFYLTMTSLVFSQTGNKRQLQGPSTGLDDQNQRKMLGDDFFSDDDFFKNGGQMFKEMQKIRQRFHDMMADDPFMEHFDDFGKISGNGFKNNQDIVTKHYEDDKHYYFEIQKNSATESNFKVKVEDHQLIITNNQEIEKEDRDAKGNKSYMKTKSSVTRSFPLENYVDPAGYDISEQRDKLVIKFKKNTQIKNKKTVNARKEDYI